MPRNNTTSPAKIAAASRRRDAVELRMMGRTYGEIGAALGVSRPHAFRLVSAEIGRMAAEAQEATNALRALELDRLDAAQVAIWDRVTNVDFDAIDRLLKISARRCALLGLDRPVKVAPTNPAGDAEFEGGGLAALLKAAAG